jgi:hypothetical protein
MCAIHCFEKCLKFITRQAYVHIALFGDGFLSGARGAFNLIARNFVKLTALNVIGSVMMWMGKLLVVVLVSLLAYAYLDGKFPVEGISGVDPVMPTLVCALLAYLVASLFMQVFELAINTILHCYVADTEAHGRAEYAHSRSKLGEIMGKYERRTG